MKNFFFPAGIVLLGFTLQAQTSHTVLVSSNSFTPADLTVQVGDTVIWTNTGGFHNVSTDPYPENPEAFGNELSADAWTFTHIFTLQGINLYQCDVHSGSMQGSVTVEDPTLSANYPDENAAISIFPNPATDILKWNLNDFQLPADTYFTLFDLTGKKVAQFKMNNNSFIDISYLTQGIYHYEIKAGIEQIQTGKLLFQTR